MSVRVALWAQVFDNPLVARNLLRDCLLHQLLAGVDGRTAGDPLGPDELLRAGMNRVLIATFIAELADCLAVFATRFARSRNAEVFTLAAPAGDLHLLSLANEPAGFLTGIRTTAVIAAKGGR